MGEGKEKVLVQRKGKERKDFRGLKDGRERESWCE